MFVILLNALWLSVDIDRNGKSFREADIGFQCMDILFCLTFISEIAIRFSAFQNLSLALHNSWFVFDFCLTASMVVELLLGTVDIKGVGFLSAFRILRLVRIARMSKLARLFPELGILVKSIIAGIRSAAMTGLVLVSITYAFALIMTSLSVDTPAAAKFPDVPTSLYVLMVQGMAPDNEDAMAEVSASRWYQAMLLTFFLFLSAITIMNMLIGILCQVMTRVSADHKANADLRSMSDKLHHILGNIDTNYDDAVSREEFESMLDHEEVRRIFLEMDVDMYALLDDIDYIFPKDGVDEKKLPFKEFMETVLEFQATNAAAIRSIAALRKSMRFGMATLERRMSGVESLVSQLPTTFSGQLDHAVTYRLASVTGNGVTDGDALTPSGGSSPKRSL
jgi:hypothetical protein